MALGKQTLGKQALAKLRKFAGAYVANLFTPSYALLTLGPTIYVPRVMSPGAAKSYEMIRTSPGDEFNLPVSATVRSVSDPETTTLHDFFTEYGAANALIDGAAGTKSTCLVTITDELGQAVSFDVGGVSTVMVDVPMRVHPAAAAGNVNNTVALLKLNAPQRPNQFFVALIKFRKPNGEDAQTVKEMIFVRD